MLALNILSQHQPTIQLYLIYCGWWMGFVFSYILQQRRGEETVNQKRDCGWMGFEYSYIHTPGEENQKHVWTMNIQMIRQVGRNRVTQLWNRLIGELARVLSNSPLIHICSIITSSNVIWDVASSHGGIDTTLWSSASPHWGSANHKHNLWYIFNKLDS